jgi:hypothetical protein
MPPSRDSNKSSAAAGLKKELRSKSVGMRASRVRVRLNPISHDQLESVLEKYKALALITLAKDEPKVAGPKTLLTEVDEEES